MIGALAVSLTAWAQGHAAPDVQRQISGPKAQQTAAALSQAVPVSPRAVRISPKADSPVNAPRRAVTAADYEGDYLWSGTNYLSQEIFPNSGTMRIAIDPQDPSRLLIEGFDANTTLTAYVEESTGRLIVPNQYSFYASYYDQEVWFWNYTVTNSENENGELIYQFVKNDQTPYFFEMTDNGDLRAGAELDTEKWQNFGYTDEELMEVVCLAANVMPDNLIGYYWFCGWVEAHGIKPFEFVESEWTYEGEALFKDAWFPFFWEDGVTPTYTVPCYSNVANPDLYLLKNPYGPQTPYGEVNLSDRDGYLIFDTNYPECVPFSLFTYSLSQDIDGNEAEPFYCFNMEGYLHYFSGYTLDMIPDYLRWNNGTLPTTYDPAYKALRIRNPRFTFGNRLDTWYNWTDAKNQEGFIVLPGGQEPPAPEIYLFGENIDGTSFVAQAPDSRMEYIGDGIYTWTGSRLGGYFLLLEPESWTSYGGSEYLNLDTPYNLLWDGNYIWFATMDYVENPVVRYDSFANKMTVTGTPGPELDYYMWIQDGWGHTATLQDMGGVWANTYAMCLADMVYLTKSYRNGYNVYYGSRNGSPDEAVSIGKPYELYSSEGGVYQIPFEGFSYLWNPRVEFDPEAETLTIVSGAPYVWSPAASDYPEKLYITADGLEEADAEMTHYGDGIYVWQGALLPSGFLINDGHGTPKYNIGYIDAPVTLDHLYGYVAGRDALPFRFAGYESVADAVVTVNLNTWEINISFNVTGVDAVDADSEAEAVYYDLNGLPVANPGKGIFIRIAGGHASKVVKY